jgi:hypothetical protein
MVDTASAASLLVRVAAAEPTVELRPSAGPLDVSNGVGQEMMLRVRAPSIRTNGEWWTDSNGLQLMKRTRLQNTSTYKVYEPVAQNTYPATAIAAIVDAHTGANSDPDYGAAAVASDKDAGSTRGVALLLDAARGVSSVSDGSLDVMLHRRLVDHGCREDEGYQLDDARHTIASVRVCAADTSVLARRYRVSGQRALHPLGVFFGPARASGMAPTLARDARKGGGGGSGDPPHQVGALPINLHLHTLTLLDEASCDPFALAECRRRVDAGGGGGARRETLLVRLQHLFGEGEDAQLARPTSVDLVALLAPRWKVLHVDESTLTAGRVIGEGVDATALVLAPMQIRTFLVDVAVRASEIGAAHTTIR